MTTITIWRAKPNPIGKDKNQHTPKPEQLNGEWVEIKNASTATVDVKGAKLAHTRFDNRGKPESTPEIYWEARSSIVLRPGETLRVHTGKSTDPVKADDQMGADKHAFAEKGSFKLNNAEGDILYLYFESKTDKASYDPGVGEGAVLSRVGDKLIGVGSGGTSPDKPWTAPAVIGPSGKAA